MLFFLIERKEDNIYDFFTIQKDCKVVWFTGCPAWGYSLQDIRTQRMWGSRNFLSCLERAAAEKAHL